MIWLRCFPYAFFLYYSKLTHIHRKLSVIPGAGVGELGIFSVYVTYVLRIFSYHLYLCALAQLTEVTLPSLIVLSCPLTSLLSPHSFYFPTKSLLNVFSPSAHSLFSLLSISSVPFLPSHFPLSSLLILLTLPSPSLSFSYPFFAHFALSATERKRC